MMPCVGFDIRISAKGSRFLYIGIAEILRNPPDHYIGDVCLPVMYIDVHWLAEIRSRRCVVSDESSSEAGSNQVRAAAIGVRFGLDIDIQNRRLPKPSRASYPHTNGRRL